MSDGTDETEGRTTVPPEAGADAAVRHFAREQMRAEQNLVGGIAAGAAAAMLGAGLWAGLTILTGYQIGFMALGVGFLVGLAVRTVGKGLDPAFGIAGAVLSLLGCAGGNLLAICGVIARQEGVPFLELVSRLDPGVAQGLMVATFSPMDLLFYGIAVWEGYRLSFRPEDSST